jgi:hypothetical protein
VVRKDRDKSSSRSPSSAIGSAVKAGFSRETSDGMPKIAVPLLEYGFNETGITVGNSGKVGAAAALSLERDGKPTDLHSTGAQGVSGRAEDRAFDNSAADGMGGTARSGFGLAVSRHTITEVVNLKTYTLTGWYKVPGETPFGHAARIIEHRASRGGFALLAAGDELDQLQFDGGTNEQRAFSNRKFTAKNIWVAFAVVVDVEANTVTFYSGTVTAPIEKINTVSLQRPLATNGAQFGLLGIGNAPGRDRRRPFDGMLDNIRVFDSAMTLETLEQYRQKDIKGQ